MAGLFLATPALAVELPDLAGDWAIVDFSGPSRLRETYYNIDTLQTRVTTDSSGHAQQAEVLVDAFYPDPAVASTRTFAVSTAGAVTGGETGQILSLSSNRILYSDGNEVTTVYASTAGDVMLASSRDEDQQEVSLCLKRPSTLEVGDLAGSWSLVNFISPDDLSKNIDSGRLVDVFYSEDASVAVGSINVAGTGNFNGIFSGILSTPGVGIAVATTGGDSVTFQVSASKNFMVSASGDDDERELVMLVKKPATITTADLAGAWRLVAYQIPNSLTESFYHTLTEVSRQADSSGTARANEVLSDLFHSGSFELNRYLVQVESSGAFTGAGAGTITAGINKTVRLSQGGEIVTLYPNADKTVMISGSSFSDAQEFIVALKVSDQMSQSFSGMVDMKLLQNESLFILNWNSASNLQLEELTDPGGWSVVPEAAGADSFVVDTSVGDSRFFRVADVP